MEWKGKKNRFGFTNDHRNWKPWTGLARATDRGSGTDAVGADKDGSWRRPLPCLAPAGPRPTGRRSPEPPPRHGGAAGATPPAARCELRRDQARVRGQARHNNARDPSCLPACPPPRHRDGFVRYGRRGEERIGHRRRTRPVRHSAGGRTCGTGRATQLPIDRDRFRPVKTTAITPRKRPPGKVSVSSDLISVW